MRRQSSIESQTFTPHLHPALQAVLENLDVRLDEELTRYRRLRARKPVAPSKRRNLTASAAVAPGTKGVSRQDGKLEHPSAALPLTQSELVQPSPLPPAPSLAALQEADPVRVPQPFEPPVPEATSVSALASRLVVPTPGELQTGGHPSIPVQQDFFAPEAPLESSDQLLRSLADEETELRQREQDPGVLASLLTPLGIGSMLLLLLSSVTFGYLLMNPATLGLVGLGNSTPASSTPTEEVNENTTSAPSATTPSDTAVVQSGPNLAEQEFPNLSLDTLPGATAQSPVVPPTPAIMQPPNNPPDPPSETAQESGSTLTPTPASPAVRSTTTPRVTTVPLTPPAAPPQQEAATAAPTRPPATRPTAPRSARPTETARAAERPAARQTARPETASAPSQPSPPAATRPASPAASESQTAAARSPARPGYSYVVVPFQGDRSLEEARRVVGDAYVRNFPDRTSIQMGVFSDAERADQLRQELRQQGIEAEVYRPSGQ